VSYVKAHGALHHAVIEHPDYATAVIAAVARFESSLPLMCQPGTSFAAAVTAAGLSVVAEGYVDRGYSDDGLLVPREHPGALITDPAVAAQRAVEIALSGTVRSVTGAPVPLRVSSLCIHSDSPGAVEVASETRAALLAAGVSLAPLPATPGP
jgi:UPF0271 protein